MSKEIVEEVSGNGPRGNPGTHGEGNNQPRRISAGRTGEGETAPVLKLEKDLRHLSAARSDKLSAIVPLNGPARNM
jgi:hypothetical protein